MRRAWAVVVVVAACHGGSDVRRGRDAAVARTVADAGASADAAPDARSYKTALARGRERARDGDWAAAMAAFREALAARPDDGRALSELSWAALQAGDPATAKDVAGRAVAVVVDPRLRASSLYNLGRALEADGDRAGALDAYQRSLALRPSRTVEQRARALSSGDPDGAAEAPRPLLGPFAAADAYCASLGIEQRAPDPIGLDDPWCAVEAVASGPAPFGRVAAVRHADGDDEGVDVAIEVAARWWVLPDVAPGDPASSARVTAGEDDGRLVVRTSGALAVCGVGASKVPSCLGPVESTDGAPPRAVAFP